MKRFQKAKITSGGGQATKKYANDHPLDACASSERHGTRKTALSPSKQGRLYGPEYIKGQASTRIAPAHPGFKEKCSRDRAWIKHAYLQGTELTENRPNGNTDASDCTRGSKQQIKPKRDGDLIAKKLVPLNQKSSEMFTMEHLVKKPSVVDSSPKAINKALKPHQTCKIEAAESKHKFARRTETSVHINRSIEKLQSQKNCREVGMEPQSHKMDSAAIIAELEDKGTLVKLQVKPADIQKEEAKASGFPNFKRVHHEYEDMSSEYKSFKRLPKRNKVLTKQASLPGTLRLEEVTLKHHHSVQHRKGKDRRAPSNTASVNPRDVVQKKSSDTAKHRAIEYMQERPVEMKAGIKLWREQGESRTRKVELTQRKASSRPVMEMVAIKYPHRSSCNMPSGKVNGPMNVIKKQKTTNCRVERHAKRNRSKGKQEELPVCMKGATDSEVESVEEVMYCTTNTDRNFPLKCKSDMEEPNFAQTMDCTSGTLMSCGQDQQRETVTKQLSKTTPKQNCTESDEIEDSESATEKVATRIRDKITLWQHRIEGFHTDEASEKPILLNHKISQEQGVSKDEPNDNAQADTNDIHECEPELPERGYLEDIDFVVSEFDMILHTTPKLPAREYLKDIDFVSKELFFRRKSSHQFEEEPLWSTELDSDANESNSDVITKVKHDYPFLSEMPVHNQNPCDHEFEPLMISSKERSSPDVYVNHPLNTPHTSVSQCNLATDSSESQYQPLISATRMRSSYDRIEFRAFKTPILPLPDIDDTAAASSAVKLDKSHYQPEHVAPDSSESQYQPLISATRVQDPSSRYDRVSIRAPILPLQEAAKAIKEDEDNIDDIIASGTVKLEESYYQPLVFDGQKDQSQRKSTYSACSTTNIAGDSSSDAEQETLFQRSLTITLF
jgi:hypothetical protein